MNDKEKYYIGHCKSGVLFSDLSFNHFWISRLELKLEEIIF